MMMMMVCRTMLIHTMDYPHLSKNMHILHLHISHLSSTLNIQTRDSFETSSTNCHTLATKPDRWFHGSFSCFQNELCFIRAHHLVATHRSGSDSILYSIIAAIASATCHDNVNDLSA